MSLILRFPVKLNREFTQDWAVATQVLLLKVALKKNCVFFFRLKQFRSAICDLLGLEFPYNFTALLLMKLVTIDSVVEESGVYYPTNMQNFIQVGYGWQWSKWYIF